ncbi:MAG: hypothetical protein Tsb0027_04800 [Wenzhouxiangellaceae bacterium]
MLTLPDGSTGGADATDDYSLMVKFVDIAQARVSKTGLYSQTAMDLSAAMLLATDAQAQFVQVLSGTNCPGLGQLQNLAVAGSGREQPDMQGLHRCCSAKR